MKKFLFILVCCITLCSCCDDAPVIITNNRLEVTGIRINSDYGTHSYKNRGKYIINVKCTMHTNASKIDEHVIDEIEIVTNKEYNIGDIIIL